MKIVYFIDGLNPGGVENVVLSIANYMSAFPLNHISVVCLYKDQNNIVASFDKRVNVFFLPFTAKKKNLFYYIRYAPLLSHLLKKLTPDVIHAHNASGSLLYLALVARMSGIKTKYIRTMHFAGFFLLRQTIGDRVRFLVDKVATKIMNATIVAVSPIILDLVRNLYSTNSPLCITNGVDADNKYNPINYRPSNIRAKHNVPMNHKIAIYVARMVAGKNHLTLLKAWKIISNQMSDVHLILLGDGPLRSDICHYIKANNMEASVYCTSTEKNVAEYMSISDIAILTSESEGFCLSLIEGMSMELPTIVSDIPSLKNIVDDFETGIFYSTYDEVDLAGKIELLMKDKDLRLRLGRNARHCILNNYTIEHMLEKYKSLYDSII